MSELNQLPGKVLEQDGYNVEVQESSQSCPSEQRNQNTSVLKNSVKRICPPRGWPIKYLTWAMVLGAFVGALWSVIPEEMSPHHDVFGLVITVILCFAAEQLIVKVPTPHGYPPLPPLFASLLMGLMLRNLPSPGNIAVDINTNVSSVLRKLALTVILTRAGLEINPKAMRKVKWAVIRLAFSPCLIETILIGVLAYYILDFTFIWSFMLGFVIAAVSPAVVVPSLILLKDAGYGIAKGIPSLVIAASGIDDVLAITGFTILLGIAIPTGADHDFISLIESLIHPSASNDDILQPTTTIADATTIYDVNSTMTSESLLNEDNSDIGREIGAAVVEVVLGVLSGLLLGLVIAYVPYRRMKYKTFCRGFLLLSIGIFMVFATSFWGIAGAGTLCALIMSFTASLKWKTEAEPLAEAWHYLWVIFQPVLFGLTGALVDVYQMDGRTVGLGLAVLGIAIIGRLLTSTAVTFGLKLDLKERVFVSIAWIPKGTVQAALCSAALDQAIAQDLPEEDIYHATQILVLAVLITLITAPLGAFAINISGPRLLAKTPTPHHNGHDFSTSQSDSSSEEKDPDFAMTNVSRKDGLYKSEEEGVNLGYEDETKSTKM